MTNTNEPGRALAITGGLPAVTAAAHNALILPVQAPPAPTPVGADQNFGFRRSAVRLAVAGLGVDPAMNDRIPTSGLPSAMYQFRMDCLGREWIGSPWGGDGGWASVCNAIMSGIGAAENARMTAVDRVKALRKASAATEAFAQFQDAVPAAAQALAQALAPADMDFVRAEVGAFLAGRRDKRCASGEGFLTDVLGAVLDMDASCGAISLAFQSLRSIGGSDYVDPQANEASAYIRHWNKALTYLAKIIAELASLPPATELRATIEAEIETVIAAEEERQRKEAEERDARALEQMRQAAEEEERRQEARMKFEAEWEAERRAKQEADRQASERRAEICRRDAAEELRRQGLPVPEHLRPKTPQPEDRAPRVGGRRQARDGGKAA